MGLVRAAGPGWVFVPPTLQEVSVAHGAGLIPCPKGSCVSRERAQRGKKREKTLAAFYPLCLPPAPSPGWGLSSRCSCA